MISMKYGDFVQDLSYIIPTKQQFIVPPAFNKTDRHNMTEILLKSGVKHHNPN
jgi:hypothetical protein